MREWIIKLGKKEIPLTDVDETADAIEMCTRAIEFQKSIGENFAVESLIEAKCGEISSFCKSEIILANAGLYKHAVIMQDAIKKYLASIPKVSKPKKVKE